MSIQLPATPTSAPAPKPDSVSMDVLMTLLSPSPDHCSFKPSPLEGPQEKKRGSEEEGKREWEAEGKRVEEEKGAPIGTLSGRYSPIIPSVPRK